MILLVGAAAVGLILLLPKTKGEGGFALNSKRLYGLPDCEISDQKGSYKKDFDLYFMTAADETGVPFALLKAHALMESSLNPRAFRDENPTKRTDRIGWASRGLMQLLFWPKSERFKKYGFGPERDPDDLYDPMTNIRIAAKLVRDNLNACSGNLRDAVNMYNAGVKESTRAAPHDYVKRVLVFYSNILGRKIS